MADNIPPPGSIRYVGTSKRFGVYAGSFDPMTVGHLWMVEQGVSLFDRLVVAVGINPGTPPAGFTRSISITLK